MACLKGAEASRGREKGRSAWANGGVVDWTWRVANAEGTALSGKQAR